MKVAALVISLVSLFVSGLAFYWVNLRTGRLVVAVPNTVSAQRKQFAGGPGTIIAFPVSVANTGAVVHTVDMLTLRVKRTGGGFCCDYDMATECESLPSDKHVFAASFAVAPRSSHRGVVTFYPTQPRELVEGTYECTLCAYQDGGTEKPGGEITFKIVVDSDAVGRMKDVDKYWMNYRVWQWNR